MVLRISLVFVLKCSLCSSVILFKHFSTLRVPILCEEINLFVWTKSVALTLLLTPHLLDGPADNSAFLVQACFGWYIVFRFCLWISSTLIMISRRLWVSHPVGIFVNRKIQNGRHDVIKGIIMFVNNNKIETRLFYQTICFRYQRIQYYIKYLYSTSPSRKIKNGRHEITKVIIS